ncbi:hypothetical protein OHA25_60670 (plasmid) [Nonomuraea sp. NBC_00507]|uniref:hypothetical protein n=1 Tax=Nonomuraea sp. NBC_00507 TaxID=2976002 RepID=UPI002E19A8D0
MSINWSTVATSALTALIVTLGVEYLAKPRLEARKERILDALRARRELLTSLTVMAVAADAVRTKIPHGIDATVRERLVVERTRQYDRLRDEAQRLGDTLPRYVSVFVGPVRTLLVSYASTTWGLLLSAQAQYQQAETIYEMTQQLATVLDGPRWRPHARVAALIRLREAIGETLTMNDNG